MTYTVAKAAISGVPIVGSPAAEFFAYLVAAPLERRRQSWAEDVGRHLRELTERVAGLEDRLGDNPRFADIALHATQAAMRTSSTIKREALRNVVLNAALDAGIDVELEHLFVRLIDALSPQQIRLLLLFNDPPSYLREAGRGNANLSMGGLAHVVGHAFPELTGRRDLYDQLWKELYSRGLVNTDSLHVMMTGHGLMQARTTDLARQFLTFIRQPAAD